MSKTLSPAAAAHLAAKVTTLATCWRVERQDGTVSGYTDFHEDLEIDGVTYLHATGIGSTSATEANSTLGVDNLDVVCVLDSETITHDDILSGLYNDADIYIFLVDHGAPASFLIKLFRGRFGEFKVNELAAHTEVRSLTQRLRNRIGIIHQGYCCHALGDARCGVDLEAIKETITVTALDDDTPTNLWIVATLSRAAAQYHYGRVRGTSGANAGRWGKVKHCRAADGGYAVTTFEDLPYDVAIGDSFDLYPGCDKTLTTCTGRFGNDAFLGFPHIPGHDWMMSYPDVQS